MLLLSLLLAAAPPSPSDMVNQTFFTEYTIRLSPPETMKLVSYDTLRFTKRGYVVVDVPYGDSCQGKLEATKIDARTYRVTFYETWDGTGEPTVRKGTWRWFGKAHFESDVLCGNGNAWTSVSPNRVRDRFGDRQAARRLPVGRYQLEGKELFKNDGQRITWSSPRGRFFDCEHGLWDGGPNGPEYTDKPLPTHKATVCLTLGYPKFFAFDGHQGRGQPTSMTDGGAYGPFRDIEGPSIELAK